MATYFDLAAAADVLLLHESVRDHNELARIASAVETDVINHYRERNERGLDRYTYYGSPTVAPFVTSDGKYIVWLDGYKEDADEADTRLKDALRRTIADVVSHRLRYYDEERGVQSWTQGRVSVTFSGGGRDTEWPKGWSRRLAEFNLNPAYL